METRKPNIARLAALLVVASLLATASTASSAPTKKRSGAGVRSGEVSIPAAKTATPPQAAASDRASDSSYTLKAGEDGRVFRSLTIEGEDRIRLEFDRPELKLDLDPAKAPGLEWGTARDVLDRTTPDLTKPLLESSSTYASPWTARPWLARFATGAVARFRPEVENVERWKLTVANARGEAVTTFEGKGDPPREIAWDGRSRSGAPVLPGLTYSYVFEAVDRAGNKRHFVGQGFQVTAYRIDGDAPLLVFTGAEMGPAADSRSSSTERASTPAIVLEAATWLNQDAKTASGPIRVTGVARSAEQADQLARRVVATLTPYLIGDPSRLQPIAEVQPDAPDGGTVRIAAATAVAGANPVRR